MVKIEGFEVLIPLISRKIMVAGKLLNFHSVKYPQSKFPIRLPRSVIQHTVRLLLSPNSHKIVPNLHEIDLLILESLKSCWQCSLVVCFGRGGWRQSQKSFCRRWNLSIEATDRGRRDSWICI